MAAVVVREGELNKALKRLAKILQGEAIHARGAATRRFMSRAERKRMKRRHAQEKARK